MKYIKLDTPGLIRATNSRGEALIDLFAIADPTTSLDIGTTPIDADTTITNQKSYYSVGPGYYVAVLGTLQANDRIYFTFDFLRPTEDTPSVFMPQILDNTRTPLAPQPTGFGMTYSIPLAV